MFLWHIEDLKQKPNQYECNKSLLYELTCVNHVQRNPMQAYLHSLGGKQVGNLWEIMWEWCGNHASEATPWELWEHVLV